MPTKVSLRGAGTRERESAHLVLWGVRFTWGTNLKRRRDRALCSLLPRLYLLRAGALQRQQLPLRPHACAAARLPRGHPWGHGGVVCAVRIAGGR